MDWAISEWKIGLPPTVLLKVNQLEEDNNKLSKMNSQKQIQIANLEQVVGKHKLKNDEQKNEEMHMIREVKSVNDKFDKAQEQVVRCQNELAQRDYRIRMLEQKAGATAVDEIKTNLLTETEVFTLRKTIEKLQGELKTLKAEKNNELHNSFHNVSLAEKIGTPCKGRFVASEAQEIEKLQREKNIVEDKVANFDTKIKQLTQQLECQRHNFEAAKSTLEMKFKERENNLRVEIKQHTQLITDMDKVMNETKMKLLHAQSQISTMESLKLSLEKEKEISASLLKEKQMLSNKVEELSRKQNDDISALQFEINTKQQQMTELNKKLDTLSFDNVGQCQANQQLKVEYNKLQNEVEQLKISNSKLKSEKDNLREQLKVLAEKITNETTQLLKESESKDIIIHKVKAETESILKEKALLEQHWRIDVEKLQNDLKLKILELDDINNKLTKTTQKLELALSDIHTKTNAIVNLQDRVNSLEENNCILNSQLTKNEALEDEMQQIEKLLAEKEEMYEAITEKLLVSENKAKESLVRINELEKNLNLVENSKKALSECARDLKDKMEVNLTEFEKELKECQEREAKLNECVKLFQVDLESKENLTQQLTASVEQDQIEKNTLLVFIEELNNDIASLQNDNVINRDYINGLETDLQTKENEICQLSMEVEKLTNEKGSLDNAGHISNKQLEEIVKLQQALTAKDETETMLNGRFKSLNEEIEVSKQNLKLIKDSEAALNDCVKTLNCKIEELKQALTCKENNESTLNDDVTSLKIELETTKQMLSTKEEKEFTLKENLNLLNEKLYQEKTAVENLQQTSIKQGELLISLKQEKEKVELELKDSMVLLTEELEKKNVIIQQLCLNEETNINKIDNLVCELKEFRDTTFSNMASVRNDLDEKEKANSKLNERIASLENEYHSKIEEVECLKSEKSKIVDDLKNKDMELHELVEKTNKEMSLKMTAMEEIEIQRNILNDELNITKMELQNMEHKIELQNINFEELDKRTKRVSELSELLETSQQELNLKTERYQSLSNEMTTLTNSISNLESHNLAVWEDNQLIQKQLVELQEESKNQIDKLMNALKEAGIEAEAHHEQMNVIEQELALLKEEQKENDSLQDLIALKDQELSEVLQNLGSKTDSYLDCLNELEKTKLEVSKLEVLNEEKNESLATLNKHFLNAKAALIQANTENNAIEKLKSLLEMEKSAKITLETRIESMGLEISSLKAVLQEKHQEITQLTEEKFKVVEDMQCEITRLVKEKQQEMALLIEKNQHEISLVMEVKEKGQYEQLEQKQQEITQLKEQLSLCREEKAVVDVKCRELAREIDGYSIKLSQLEELRLSHDQSFEEIVDRLSEAKREISKLQAEVTNGECHSVELQQNHRTSQRRICDLELKYANSMEKMNGKFNSLRHEIEDKKQEIEELQLKLTVAVNTSNNDRIEMELQSLREEVTRLKESNNSYEENVEKLMEEQCTKNDALSKLEQELTLSIASSVEKNNYINCFQASLSQIRSYFYSHMSSGVISEKGNNKVPDSEILEYLHIELMDKTKSLANLKTVLDEKVTALEKRLASVPVTPSYTCPLDEALAKIESLKTFLLKKTQELQALNRDVEHINPDFYNDVVDTPCGDVLDSVSCLVPGSSALPNLGTVYQNLAGTLEDFEENLKRVKTGLPLNHPAAFVEISKLIQEIAVVKNSRAELNKLVSKLEKEKAETLKEVQNLQKELHSISQVVLGQSSDSVFSEVKAVFEKFEEMNKKLVAKDEVIRSLSNTIEEVEENLQGEYEEKISLAKKVENLERLNSLQLDEIKKLTGKLTELDYELDKAKEIEGKLEQDLLSEKSAACEKIVELNSKIALQTTEVSMLSNKLQEIEFELTKSQITVNELVVEKTSTLEFISKLNVTITSKSEEVNALTLEVSRLEQCASSKGFLYEIEELQATKSSQVEEIAKLMEKLKDVELKLSRSQLKIDELITEKSSTSELVLELNVTNSSQAGEINALSQKLSHLESEIVASKEAVDKIEELRADRLSALDKVVELKATNASQSEIIQQLTNQLSEINIKFNQAEAIDKSVQELVLEKKEFEVTIRNLYENLTGKDSNISQLNQEIEHLVKEIGVVREERDKYITSEKGLHQQIDVLNSKINNMNNDHDRSCQELRRKLLDEFSVEKVGLLLKMEQLESWADDDEKARQDLHDKVQELTKKLEDCQAVIDNLNISLNQAEKEMQDLRTENVRLVEEGNFARQYADEVVDELGEVEDVMKQNSSLKDKIYQLQYQHDNLKECVTNLETRNKELDNCLKTYEDTSGEVKNLMSIINDLEMKLNSTSDQKTELEGVKAKWEETETHLKTMQKLIEELQSEKEKWIGKQSEVLVLEKELEFVKAAKNESEKNLIALQDQMIINEVKITSLEANQAFLEKETDKLLLKVSELKLQIDLRNQQIEKKSLENNQLQSQLREMIVKTDQESVEVKSEITEARGLFEIVKEKDNEVLKLKELLDTTEKAYSEIQTELNVSKNENEMKSKELQVKEIRIAKLCVSLQTLEKSLDFQKMELHSLNDRLSSASTSDKVILLEHRITLLQDELRIVRKEKDYFSDNCTKLEEELDLECQNNAQAIAKMKSSINEKELQLLEQVSLLEEKLSAINIEKTQLEAHCDKLKVELDERGDIDCSYSALKAKYSEKEFQLSEAIARLRETEDKRKISLDKLEEIEKLYEKSEDVVANYKKKVDDLTKVKNELEKDKSSLKGKIFLSNKTMKCYSYDLDNLQKDHKNLQELFIEMKAEKVKFEDLYTEIKTKFNELNRKLELVRKDLTEKELKIGTLIGDNRKLLAEKNDKLNFIKQLEEASKNRPLSTLPKVSVSAASVRSERTLRQRKQSISPEESNVQLKKSRQTIFTKGITKLNLDQPMIEPVSSFTRSGRRRTLSADDDFKLSSRMSLLTDFGSSTMTLKPIATSLNQRKENKPFGLSRSSHAITSKDVSTIKHATATKNRSQCSADGTSDGPPDCKQQ